MIRLFDYQKEIAKQSTNENKNLWFMDTGTGKTFTAFEYIRLLKLKQNIKSVLFIAPKHTLTQLEEEQAIFGLDVCIDYINYEKLIRKPINEYDYVDIVIIDEAHRIKSEKSKISKYIRRLSNHVKNIVAMTGTAVCNKYGDLFMIALNIGKILFYDGQNKPILKYNKFMQICYETTLEKNRMSNRYYYKFGSLLPHAEKWIKDSLIENVHIKNAEFEKIIEPKPIIINVEGMEKTKQYKELKKSIITNEDGTQDTLIFLTKEMKLRQAALGFYYDQYKNSIIFSKKYVNTLKDVLFDFMEKDEKVIVVYQFETELKMITDTLKYKTTTDIDEFKNDTDVLLLHISKAEGLNLQFAHIMVFYSYDYSYYKFKQAIARIYRIGQKHQPTVYLMKPKNTIYEEVFNALINKKSYDEYIKSLEKYN